jgi:predicted alpha/beta superfamily hydrolase
LPGQLLVHDDFHSEALGCQRTLVVYLPPGYGRDTRRQYPVLLFHDGQNIFDGRTSYVPGQYWRAKESADDLLANRLIEPLIMVAIYHGGEKRIHEYTPTRTRKLGGGGANLHAWMLVEELRPWLRDRYRILPQARHTALCGSSLGGLATLYLGLTHPQVFGRLGVMSPSVWWDHRVILKMLQTVQHPERQRMWLDIGTEEGNAPFGSTRDVRLLKATLVSKGWREGRSLAYLEAEGADHSERAWAERLPAMLQYLFPRKAK